MSWNRKPQALAVLDDAMEILATVQRIEVLNKINRAVKQMKARTPDPVIEKKDT